MTAADEQGDCGDRSLRYTRCEDKSTFGSASGRFAMKGATSMMTLEGIRCDVAQAVGAVRREAVGGFGHQRRDHGFRRERAACGRRLGCHGVFADEGEFLVDAGGAVYVNMGTLLPVYEQTVPAVARRAHEAGKPWVLDPVGIGIGSLRTDILLKLKDRAPSIVRGNASEIIALAGLWGLEGDAAQMGRVRGVDSTDPVEAARCAAVALARWTGGAVAVSGEEDLVTDGDTVVFSQGGSSFMEKVTGFGCSLGGVMAVYAAVADPFVAAVAASRITTSRNPCRGVCERACELQGGVHRRALPRCS